MLCADSFKSDNDNSAQFGYGPVNSIYYALQVKRRQRTVVSATAPGMLLLTLLAECCVVSLEEQAHGGAAMAQVISVL